MITRKPSSSSFPGVGSGTAYYLPETSGEEQDKRTDRSCIYIQTEKIYLIIFLLILFPNVTGHSNIFILLTRTRRIWKILMLGQEEQEKGKMETLYLERKEKNKEKEREKRKR